MYRLNSGKPVSAYDFLLKSITFFGFCARLGARWQGGFIILPPFSATSLDGLGWVRMERIVESPAAGRGGVYK